MADRLAAALEPGRVALIGGPSGAGKSTLLRAVLARARQGVVDLVATGPPPMTVVDCLPDLVLTDALRLLSRVGLGEARTYLQRADELSDGERWRLRLALAIDRSAASGRPALLVADEFACGLDRISALVAARAVRRAVADSSNSLCALVASAREDLAIGLRPDVHVICDFGTTRLVDHTPREEP
jgi:ABC-type ATPase with predicted acetyltransferase domain